MSELVTIYKAQPENVSEIVNLLESRHLHPVVVDDIGKTGSYRTGRIRIAVPETERDIALSILADNEKHNEKRLSELIKGTNAVVLIIIALLVLAAIVGFFDEQGRWFFAVWILITVCVGAALIRLAWSGKSGNREK